MDPEAQILYLSYWTGIDRLGPQAGERFMVAYLRAVRDYINAFGYGVDQDAIVGILTRETTLKDAALYSRIKLSWNDPDGAVSRAAVERYVELYRQAGMLNNPPDLSQAFDDKYSKFAVQHLGPYQAPR
jgi:NitT/TauT family transport system substrate-binding protein